VYLVALLGAGRLVLSKDDRAQMSPLAAARRRSRAT